MSVTDPPRSFIDDRPTPTSNALPRPSLGARTKAFVLRNLGTIGFGITALVFVAGLLQVDGLVAETDQTLSQLLDTAQPILTASHELEINTLELILDTWKYVATREAERRHAATIQVREFAEHLSTYRELLGDPELASELEDRFSALRSACERFMDRSIEAQHSVEEVTRRCAQIDELLDESVQSSLNDEDPTERRLLVLSQALEADVAEAQAALATWLLAPMEAREEAIEEALAESGIQLVALREGSRGHVIAPVVEDIAGHLSAASASIRSAALLEAEVVQLEGELLALRREFDQLLDDRAQFRAARALNESRNRARHDVGALRRLTGFALLVAGTAALLGTLTLIARSRNLSRANKELKSSLRARRLLEFERQRLAQRIISVEEDERTRIARDLHDDLGQELAALIIGLEGLRRDPIKSEIERLHQQALGTLQRTKMIARELRPSVLDDLGLVGAIERLCLEWRQRTGCMIDFQGPEGGQRFDREIETTIFRVAQEALTNAFKHAGAKSVSGTLTVHEGFLTLVIEDDGKGFDVTRALDLGRRGQHLGLLGMRERLALVGGTLEIESSIGFGTTLYAKVPERSLHGHGYTTADPGPPRR